MPGSYLKTKTRAIPLNRYSGEWLVLAGNKIVAHSRSLPDAILHSSKKRLKVKPAVFLVPRKDEGPYLLFA